MANSAVKSAKRLQIKHFMYFLKELRPMTTSHTRQFHGIETPSGILTLSRVTIGAALVVRGNHHPLPDDAPIEEFDSKINSARGGKRTVNTQEGKHALLTSLNFRW
jgi:hypothetical protein